MAKKPKIIIVMPAYYAEKTLERTFEDIPKNFVSEIILVDDASKDKTVLRAKKLGITTFSHPQNIGYGGNQKTCYWEALKRDPDVVVMLHPDYQYDASLIPGLVNPIVQCKYDIMLGSRIRTRKEALEGHMPLLKYLLNRVMSLTENIILGVNFSEHLTGFRAYSREVLMTIPFQRFSNDFVFDQQFVFSALSHGFRIGETPVPVRYFDEASSIGFLKGGKYILETYYYLLLHVLHKNKIIKSKLFK